ncbi:MAG: rhomboid family intramembrane serine protease [Oligoflexia bacterium]|nr:rhomboid family intramembrane serine protease [Oligoflexia bacterium]
MQQMHLPTMTKANKIIVITLFVAFLLDAVLKKTTGISLTGITGLKAASLESGFVWQLVTYPLVPGSMFEILFEALIFWFIGSELEQLWGVKKYLRFLFACLVGGTILYVLSTSIFLRSTVAYQMTLSGPGGVSSAVAVAYGILFPERTMYFFMFPLKAKWFVAIIVGMSLYQGIFSPFGLFSWCQLGNIGSGYMWMLMQTKGKFKIPGIGAMKSGKTKSVKKSHLSIVKDDDDNDITYH